MNGDIPEWLAKEVAEYDLPLKEPPKTVLDIGANIGAFTARAADKWPDAKIFAYEPLEENAIRFRANCGNGRVVLSQSAVRSFDGSADIFLGDMFATAGFVKNDRQPGTTASVTCLDALKLPDAELVKIDTEGSEVEILSRIHLDNTKAIAVEYHSALAAASIIGICTERGFEVYRHTRHDKELGVLLLARPGTLAVKKKKLFIGLPIYGPVDPHFFQCALKLMAEFSVDCVVKTLVGDSLISRARNTLTRQFLESDCTHFLQIDSDLVFSNDQIKRILEHDEDIVGGFYPFKKEGDAQLVCNRLNPCPAPDYRNLLEVRYMGTGFLCVSRQVFEEMIEHFASEIRYTSDVDEKTIEHDFWSVGVYHYLDGSKPRYLSEDWYFCQRARDLGFKVYGDLNICPKHSGNAVYPLSYQEKQLFGKSPEQSESSQSTASAIPAGVVDTN